MAAQRAKQKFWTMIVLGVGVSAAAAGLGADLHKAQAEPQKDQYADYDDDLMKDLDRTIKYLEPDVSGGNDGGVADDIAVLKQGFVYTAQYFARRGNAPDAVKISNDGLANLAEIQQRYAAKNIEAAAEKARALADSCKACHDVYKPKQARG